MTLMMGASDIYQLAFGKNRFRLTHTCIGTNTFNQPLVLLTYGREKHERLTHNWKIILYLKKLNTIQKFGHISILVNNLQEAADFYINKLGFVKTADYTMPNGYRWLTVSPKDQKDFGIIFVLADNDAKKKIVGAQAANHVLLTLQTDNCQRDYEHYQSKGITFLGEPRQMPWGTEVVFEDLYGNRFDLVQLSL